MTQIVLAEQTTSQDRDFIIFKAFILVRRYNRQINISLRWSPSWKLTLWQHSSSLKAHYKKIKSQWQISLVREKAIKSANKLNKLSTLDFNLTIVLTIIFDHSTSSSASLERKRWINKINFASRNQLKTIYYYLHKTQKSSCTFHEPGNIFRLPT